MTKYMVRQSRRASFPAELNEPFLPVHWKTRMDRMNVLEKLRPSKRRNEELKDLENKTIKGRSPLSCAEHKLIPAIDG